MERRPSEIVAQETLLKKFQAYKNDFKSIPDAVEHCYNHPEVWQIVSKPGLPDKKFNSFQEWVEGQTPWGLQTSMEVLVAICHDKGAWKVANLIQGREEPLKDHGVNQHTGVSNTKSTIPDATYKIRRLKRDHPEIHQKVIDGELSAHAGAIEAGFVKRKVSIEPTVDGIAKCILKHLSVEDIDKVFKLLSK